MIRLRIAVILRMAATRLVLTKARMAAILRMAATRLVLTKARMTVKMSLWRMRLTWNSMPNGLELLIFC